MKQTLGLLTATAALAATLTGCASMNSSPISANLPTDGLVYYLPKKNIVVSVVKAAATTPATGLVTTVSVSATAAYPDLTKPYALQFSENWIGKNTMKIGVSTTGLLSTSKSTTVPGITDALKNLAESAGMLASPGLSAAPPPPKPCGQGTHTFVIELTEALLGESVPRDVCELKLRVRRLATGTVIKAEAAPAVAGEARTGLYYRQEEAFSVEVKDPTDPSNRVNTTSVVLSPSLSPTRFLPVARTLFARNEADFGFTDGMPTKYDQETEGELIGLFKLPAEVIGAYFAAVGRLFDNLKAQDTKQAEVLVAAAKLELAKKKYEACIEAIKAKNDALVTQLGCGQ